MRVDLSFLPDQPAFQVDPVLEQSSAPAPGPRPRPDLSFLPDQPEPVRSAAPRPDLSWLPDQDDQFYDYAAAIAAGAKPDASGHWPSDFKKPGHPNEIVGGFNTRTGERVPGTPQASEQELVAQGWDPETAKRLSGENKTWWDWITETAVPAAIRTVPAIGGAVLGAGGGPLGVAAGGAGGAGLGELAAEGYEKWMGVRDEINPLQVGVQTALGAVPVVGRAGSLAKTVFSRAGQGAGLAAGADVATRLAEGQDVDLGSTLQSAAVGTVLGGGLGAVESRALNRAAMKPSVIDDLGPPPAVTPTTFNGQGPKIDVSTLPDPPIMPGVGTVEPNARPRVRAVTTMSGREIVPDRVNVGSPEAVQLEASIRPDLDVVLPPDLDAVRVSSPLSTAVESAGRRHTELPPQKPIAESDLVREDMVRMFPEEYRPELLAIIDDNAGFEGMRRGVQSNDRTDALAEFMTVSKTLNPRGTILNAPATKVLANNITTIQDDISKMQAQAAAGGLTDLDKVRLAQKKQEVVILLANHIGNSAEQGRALQIHKTLGKVIKSSNERMLQDAMRLPGVQIDEAFLAKWATATSDVERMKLIQSQQELSWPDAIVSYAISNMLSGPKTHLKNLFGSTSNAAFRLASNVAAIPYDIVMAKAKGRPRTHHLRENIDAAMGITHGFREGLDEARFILQNGYGRGINAGLSPFDATSSDLNIPRVELKPLGFGGVRLGSDPKHNPFNWPGRLLEAEDAMLSGIYRKMNQYGRISAKARTMFSGDQQKIAEMMSDFKMNPDKYPEILREAEDETRRMMLREEPGQFSKGLSNLKSKGGLLGKSMSFIIPFVKVPSNIMRQAAEANIVTAGLSHDFRRIMREGTPREQADAAGRILLGTSALATMAYWVAQGKVSGAGPSDPRERAALMESGWRPNSVKIGNQWVDYTIPFQTIAAPLATIAAGWENFSQDGDEKALGDKVWDSVTALPRTVLDQSFFSGLSDFVFAMSDGPRYLASWASRVGTSFVPLSGLQRNLAQTIDPVVRDAEGPLLERMGESVRSVIPGLSRTVDPRLTRFGEDAPRNRVDAMSPVNVVRETDDPLLTKLNRLGITNIVSPPLTLAALPDQKIPEIKLTLEQRREIGRAQRRAVEIAVRSMPLDRMDPEAARERIRRVTANARAEVAARIRASSRRSRRQE